MNKIKLTKLYKGIVGLARVTAGRTCNFLEYLELKKDFRYPGELLERMEEKGFSSKEDYISVMCGLLEVAKYHVAGTLVGSQLEDFLVRAKEKALKEKSLILLYQTIVFHYEKLGDEKADQSGSIFTEEGRKLLAQTAKESRLEELFYFLNELISCGRVYWKNQSIDLELIKTLLNTHFSEIRTLNRKDVITYADLFMTVILFSHTLLVTAGEKEIKAVFGDDPELMMTLLSFADFYEEPLKKKYKNFLIKEECFSYMDILHLNAGIWFLHDQDTHLSAISAIKWWRLLKKWFQELFKQEQEISFPGYLEKLLYTKMPQKIDGEDMTREFLLKGFSSIVPNMENSYLLFKLLNRKVNEDSYKYDCYNSINRVPQWNGLCLNHTLDLDIPGTEEWTRGLFSYLEGEWGEKQMQEIKTSLYREFVSCYPLTDIAKLDGTDPVLTGLFGMDIREFLYRDAEHFDLSDLLIRGYLSMDELLKKNSSQAKKYLGKMEDPFFLHYMEKFCESRNWQFTNDEGKFLKNAFTESWMASIAYYRKTKELHFGLFSEEEKELLLGLMCELCTRIPDIGNLDELMAGFVACRETREILGEDLSREWYQLLDARNYAGMSYLRNDYLPKEELEAIEKREMEEKRRQEEAEKKEKINKKKEELLEEIAGLSVPEQLDALGKKLPAVYSFSGDSEVVPFLELYREFPEKTIVDKNICSRFDKFFVECCKYGVISRKEMISCISKLEESKSTEDNKNE